MRISKTAVLVAAAVVAGAGFAGIAYAQQQQQASTAGAKATPKSWNYEIRDGKRVPRAARVTNADGSWREELRQGNCVTVKEKTAAGEYRETRRCD